MINQQETCVLLSIQPQWCEKIANGRKTMELRKSVPKLATPFKCYIYCTKGGRPLVLGDVFRGNWETEYTRTCGYSREEAEKIWGVLNGKIIGEFTCDDILRFCQMQNADIAEQQSLVRRDRIIEYANGKEVFGWHISDLQIYEEPRRLDEFWSIDKCPYATENGCTYSFRCFRAGQKTRCGHRIERAPQSWCYVKEG